MAKGSRQGERGIARDKFGGEMGHGDKTARQSTFKRGERRGAKAPVPIGDKRPMTVRKENKRVTEMKVVGSEEEIKTTSQKTELWCQ
jgi:hypothetical protein